MKHQISLIKIFISLLLIILFVVVACKTFQTQETIDSGYITLIVNDDENNIVSNKRIAYTKNDTLFSLLEENYDLEYETSSYGIYLTGISNNDFSIITFGDTNSWLWLEIAYLKENVEYDYNLDYYDYDMGVVTSAIDKISLVDNMIFCINYQDNQSNNNLYSALTNTDNDLDMDLIYIIFLILILILIFFIIKEKKQTITVKDLCIMSVLTVILFLQEVLLSVIPNFQFTFVLLIAYSQVLGIKKSSLILLVYLIIDNMLMGSLSIFIVVPMWVGFQTLIIASNKVKNLSNIYSVLVSIVCSIIYTLSFFIVNIYIFDFTINQAKVYFIADIPFLIMLIISSVFTTLNFNEIIKKEVSKVSV